LIGFSSKTKADLMAAGLCQLTEASNLFQISEPLVFEALRSKLKDSYMDIYFGEILTKEGTSNSCIGDNLDLCVGVVICSKYGTSVKSFLKDMCKGMTTPKPKFPNYLANVKFGFKNVIGTSHREFLPKKTTLNMNINTLAATSDGTQYYLPKPKEEGADGCGVIRNRQGQLVLQVVQNIQGGDVLFIGANKFSGGNVASAEVDANAATLDQAYGLIENAEKFKVVIRLQVVLPQGASSQRWISIISPWSDCYEE